MLTSNTNHCPLPIVVAASNHLTDVLKMAPHCPALRVLVSMDPISPAERDVITQWAASLGILFLDMTEMEAWGLETGNFVAPGPLPDEQELDEQRIATISYTSGTTGNPKGVVLTNWNMTSAVISSSYGVSSDMTSAPEWRLFSYLPLSHV